MKNYVVSYGIELEWGDIDRRIDIPSDLGCWEGPKLENGVYGNSELDAVNSDGSLPDSHGISTVYGGEINVVPTHTIDEQIEKISKLRQLFGYPFAGFVSNTHIHVYCPEIDTNKLKEYTKRYEKEFIYAVSDIEGVEEIYKQGLVDDETYNYLMYGQCRLNSFDRRRPLYPETGEESNPNEFFNTPSINLKFMERFNSRKTLEFRPFRGTTDVSLIRNCMIFCREFVNQSQLDNGMSPNEIIEFYDLTFPKIDREHVIKDFKSQRDSLPLFFKYETTNKNIWKPLLDFTEVDELKKLAQDIFDQTPNRFHLEKRIASSLYEKTHELCDEILSGKGVDTSKAKESIIQCFLLLSHK